MAWKLGRKNRLNVMLASGFIGLLVMLLAPGNYGLRILSIFGLAPDEVGSRDQRQELLIRSIIVTLRNPWGIGIGNFPIVGIRNLVTHNAYTQVSSEIGLLGLAAYLIFIISPFRKLGAIERTNRSKVSENLSPACSSVLKSISPAKIWARAMVSSAFSPAFSIAWKSDGAVSSILPEAAAC